MSDDRIAVVGALALDEIHTPHGAVRDVLGGSCAYVALAGTLLAPVEVITLIGPDAPAGFLDPLRERDVGLTSVHLGRGDTFRWGCRYAGDMETRETLYTRTGAFGTEPVRLDAAARRASHLFLTAGQTDQNRRVLAVCEQRRLTVLDTIEREVTDERATLLAMLPQVDVLTLNEYEAGVLSGSPTAPAAEQHRFLAAHGPGTLLLKRGARGVDAVGGDGTVHIDAVAGMRVVDPTGAGDSFAGAALSALLRGAPLADAVRWGCAVASFTVEDFGVAGLLHATPAGVAARAETLGLSPAAPWLPATVRGAAV